MQSNFFEKNKIREKLSFEQFLDNMKKKLDNVPDENDKEAVAEYNSLKLNYARTARILKTYNVSEELENIVKAIKEPQKWMIITEDWCGDSAQIIPHIYKIAKFNPLIELFIVLRDSNEEIMEQFLTNGTKSIPILAMFNKDGELTDRWGPRPKAAAELVKNLKESGMPKNEFIEKLHLWYGQNRGKDIEQEFISILKREL